MRAWCRHLYARWPNTWGVVISYSIAVLCSLGAGMLINEASRLRGVVVVLVGLAVVVRLSRLRDAKYAAAARRMQEILRSPLADLGDMTVNEIAAVEERYGTHRVHTLTSRIALEMASASDIRPLLDVMAGNLIGGAEYCYLIPPNIYNEFRHLKAEIRKALHNKMPGNVNQVSNALRCLKCEFTEPSGSPFDAVVYYDGTSISKVYIYLNKGHGAKVLEVGDDFYPVMGAALAILLGEKYVPQD